MNPSSNKKLSNLDIFALATGIIGLLADVISLYGIVNSSDTSKNSTSGIWVIGLFAIVYSATFMNFLIRKFFHKKKGYANDGRRVDAMFIMNEYEMAIHIPMLWIALPILTIYGYSLLMKISPKPYNNTFSTLVGSLIASYCTCVLIQHSVRYVYNFIQDEEDQYYR